MRDLRLESESSRRDPEGDVRSMRQTLSFHRSLDPEEIGGYAHKLVKPRERHGG